MWLIIKEEEKVRESHVLCAIPGNLMVQNKIEKWCSDAFCKNNL